MKMCIRLYFTLLTLFAAVSCSDEPAPAFGPSRSMQVWLDAARVNTTRTSVLDAEVTVGDTAERTVETFAETRTELLEDGFSVKWGGDDRIALWARSEDGAYAFAGQSFSLYSYILANEARFTGTITEMAGGNYRYFASSPLPERIEGPKAVYTIPAVQDGIYRSERDLLVAYPVEGAQLGADAAENPRMIMRHLCHALRIRIPEGRNRWGKPVSRLLVEFPVPVAGELSFDVSDPEATVTLAGASNAVELQFPEGWDESPADEPRYAWVFVAPGKLDGRIAFTPLFDDGYCAETLSTPVLSKTMAAGHVTPVTLTISDAEQLVTWIDFTIDPSRLGEPVNTLSITAPEGAYFRGDATQADLSARDGKYSVGYYAKFYQAAFDGATMPATYDSDNAVVSNTITLGSLAADSRNTVAIQTPWLFEEDFSNTRYSEEYFDNNGRNNDHSTATKWADEAGLSGWSGNQYYIAIGKALAIRHKTERVFLLGTYRGRVDSHPISHLKEGAAVKVNVTFKYTGNSANSNSTPVLNYGSTTDQSALAGYYQGGSGAIKGGSTIENVAGSKNCSKSGSIDAIDETAEFSITACTNRHRLSWDCYVSTSRNNTSNQWVFIDNICVSIAR